jgi:4-amino-4-deoxy-L-arabinose transferase-like glycosyltransferase
VNLKTLVAVLAFTAVSFSGASAAAAGEAEKEELRLAEVGGIAVPMAPMSTFTPKVSRPAVLPALYASLGVMQAWDVYSTRAALKAGAREANPAAAAFTGSAGSMLGLKAATTAGTILFAERMWKKNKVGAIVMLVAINGATAAVSMNNMRNARVAPGRP